MKEIIDIIRKIKNRKATENLMKLRAYFSKSKHNIKNSNKSYQK